MENKETFERQQNWVSIKHKFINTFDYSHFEIVIAENGWKILGHRTNGNRDTLVYSIDTCKTTL